MSSVTAIIGATLVNEGKAFSGWITISEGKIAAVYDHQPATGELDGMDVIDARGLILMPGVIDDQVHFRDPGLTHKGDIFTESRAAVAGGVTSFMDMPNTIPNCLTQELLEEKYAHAAEVSAANYSFYMGASNDNLEEIRKTDPRKVCGIKVFMGSSTGNMLVDDEETLTGIFRDAPTLVAVHCEDEATVKHNAEDYFNRYGEDAPVRIHPLIRSTEACYLSSSKAVELAKKHGTRLHVLHLTTAREMELFDHHQPSAEKKITAEVCVHHLWFSDQDYDRKGTFIKWNPAIKTTDDREALRRAVIDGTIDVVATDHAPHTLDEKQRPYFKAPSGGPMVQHSLTAMLELMHQKVFTLTHIVTMMCHRPADIFHIEGRGYLRAGYSADLVLVDLNRPQVVAPANIRYKCGWSPLEGETLHSSVVSTWVNGERVYHEGVIDESIRGQRLTFNREG